MNTRLIQSIRITPPENPNYTPSWVNVCTPEKEAHVQREAAKLALKRNLMAAAIADAIESDPKAAIAVAKKHIRKFSRRPTLAQTFFKQWEKILRERSISEICALMRDTSPQTEQLRISAPFVGLLPDNIRAMIYLKIYGTTHSS